MNPSSQNLHPDHGGRFVLTRTREVPLHYDVVVFLPQGRKLHTSLRWDEDGAPRLDPALDDAWARDETLKLARVLKRTPKPTLTRWRG